MKPRRLELDYLAAPRRPRWPGVVLLAASLALAAHFAVRYSDARQDLLQLETERRLIPPQRAVRALPPQRLDDQVKMAESVVRQLTLPWGPVISVLERASSPDVALLQLQPDADQRLLRLSGEARNREAMFDYLRRLSSADRLSEVHLVSHQVRQEDPQRPIQFSVQAALR